MAENSIHSKTHNDDSVNLTQLRENLSLSPLERLRQWEKNVKNLQAFGSKLKRVQNNQT